MDAAVSSRKLSVDRRTRRLHRMDGKDMFGVRGGVRLAKRKDNKWVSLIPGVTVQDIKEKGHRHEIEIIYSGTLH